MQITLPELALVVLIGPSGSGKSTFAQQHFLPQEVLSSDFFRGLVSNDPNNQASSDDAFDALFFVLEKRLKNGLLTVIDATNVKAEDRKKFVQFARRFHVLAVAIVLNLPEKVCLERNKSRPDRDFGPHVVRGQLKGLRQSLSSLSKEGFRSVDVLKTAEEVEAVRLERQPLWVNKKHLAGPFDIIGDVHGCAAELQELLERLGYACVGGLWQHPQGRTAIFVGDLVDRGPDTPQVLQWVMDMVAAGQALCVLGNHDDKLKRALEGREVTVKHGLQQSLNQLEGKSQEFRARVQEFLDGLISHYVLDGGKLVVAHAGLRQDLQGRTSKAVREFAMFGEVSNQKDEEGLPIRLDWAASYRGSAKVVYGHTAVLRPEWVNRTLDIDTGCAYGGQLSALRYPELELVSVQARGVYAQDRRFTELQAQQTQQLESKQHQLDDLLDLEDVLGKRSIETQLRGRITIPREHALAALEVISRFAINPKWLIYLPPTMSPSETSRLEGFLEHPQDALEHYRKQGLQQVICQEKHMGSRALVVICRDEAAAEQRFGVHHEAGIIYTRTGRRFFSNLELEKYLLERLRGALTASDFWQNHQTDWALFDCELLPWSAKAKDLLERQYAPVGAAALASLSRAQEVLSSALPADHPLVQQNQARLEAAQLYRQAYAPYCWSVEDPADYRLAPFHFLASEGQVHSDKSHLWHLAALEPLFEHSEFLRRTTYVQVDLHDPSSCQNALQFWENLTSSGGEGMVVKPLSFVAHSGEHLLQPALKVRGREYLRIIYGPEYTLPQHLERLRSRGLKAKRALALREFALGLEGLQRFVSLEPLRRTHEAVFGILALESEPHIDSRL
jgi:protein phosphatase